MSGRRFRRRLPIRFADVDHARVLYFPRALHILHTVMEDFFDEALGIGYRALFDDRKLGFPTVHIDVDYRAPLQFGDTVVVELSVAEIGNSKVVFGYQVWRDDTLACEATQVTVAIDPEAWTKQPIPDDIRAALEAYRR